MKRMKRIAKAAVVVVSIGALWGVASGVFAQTSHQQQDYMYCVAATEYAGWTRLQARKMCCAEVGGNWIEVYDDKGNLIDQGCTADNGNDLDDDSFSEPDPAPTPSPVNDPRVGTNSGTNEAPPATAPTRGMTSGTASS